MRVDTLTPVIAAVPGEVVACHLRIVNESPVAASLSLRVHGLGPDDSRPVPGEPLLAGQALELVVPLTIPETLTDGHHALAIEVRSDGPGSSVVLAPLTITVASLDRVILRVLPNVLRGHRSQRFVVEVDNRRDDAVAVDLRGDGQKLRVRLDPRRVHLERKQTTRVKGRVRGPRHLSGDELQHVITVSGHGASAPTYATASFIQRPVFARNLRGLLAGLVIVALWAGIIGGGLVLWSRHDRPASVSGAVAATANLDHPGTSGVPGADGSTGPGGTAGGVPGGNGTGGTGGGATAGGALPAGVIAGAPTTTLVRGTVKAGATGANGDVVVTLTPLVGDQTASTTVAAAGAPSGDAPAALRFRSSSVDPFTPPAPAPATPVVAHAGGRSSAVPGDSQAKFWSARAGTYTGGDRLIGTVGTISVESRNSDVDGAFTFDSVALRRSYEVSFSKPGFNTKSFEISPPDDGKPVEMKVVLDPGEGALGGIVDTPDRAGLGGATLTISDGTLSFTTTSSTDAATRGQWSIEGLSTPGTYTVTATLTGYGTEVAEVTLVPKGRQTDLRLTMSDQVGSISGTVRGGNGPLGGATLTASNGTTTRTTNSFTAGTKGGYLFPGLAKGMAYTITASAPGYTTKTLLVDLRGNATGIDFDLVSTFATVTGMVMSNSIVPSRRSSDHMRMPTAGTRKR